MVLVGADACTDGTVAAVHDLIADGMPVELVEGSWRRPSRVRAALVGVGRAALGDVAGEQVWLASTDADCVVPRRWIIDQVELADAGADVVLGDVSLDPDDTPAGLAGAFAAHYADAATRRRHVHAANLGIRLSAYDRAGGWRPSTAIGEEHHLVRTAAGRGAAVRWGADLTVVTSGRVESRVAGGFASVLRRLQPAEDLATARPQRPAGTSGPWPNLIRAPHRPRCAACSMRTSTPGSPDRSPRSRARGWSATPANRRSMPRAVTMSSLRRLEGASDPDDMLAVVALACPACGTQGTVVLGFGPNATAEDSDVLKALRDERNAADVSGNSAPGETAGDDSATGR